MFAVFSLVGCADRDAIDAADSGGGGRFVSRIYGGIEANVDWGADTLECTGMPRPLGEGARLRFAGPVPHGESQKQLAFILGLPGLQKGETARELATTITVIEEDAGRFFSNVENRVCWTDVDNQELVREPDDYSISGVVYCVAPLAELNGPSSVTFADLHFVGKLSWAAPQ